MFHVLHGSDQRKGAIAAVEFEGKPYSAGVSFSSAISCPGGVPHNTSILIPKFALSVPVKWE